MSPPRLHVVTDDAVLSGPAFEAVARGLLRLGDAVALHLRGHATPVRRLHELAAALAPDASRHGAVLVVADRVDVALAVDGAGARLGRRSIPVEAARRLLGGRPLYYSAHSPAEAGEAEAAGADLVVLGTIWPTASHPGRPGGGPALIEATAAAVRLPVVAIGGVTPDRVAVARAAGAHGVAVLSGVWNAPDPLAAARRFAERLAAAGLEG